MISLLFQQKLPNFKEVFVVWKMNSVDAKILSSKDRHGRTMKSQSTFDSLPQTSQSQSLDIKDEDINLETSDSSRLQVAVGAFQRKYRSMSIYGEHVIDIAERSKKALFIFPESNSIRMFCKRVVENKYPSQRTVGLIFH